MQRQGDSGHDQAYLQLAIDAGQMAIWDYDVATDTLAGNPTLYRLLGFPEGARPGLDEIRARYLPGERERIHAAGKEALLRGDRYAEVEFQYRWTDGSVCSFMLRAEMIKSEDGTPRRYLGVALDVTARNRSEARFRKSEALKESLLEASLDCIIAIDDQSRVVEWNDAAVRTFGYERKATLGQDLGDLIIPQQHRAAHRAGMERYLSTGEGPVIRNRIEIEGMRSDGTLFPVELAISPIKIGEQQFFTAFLRDITARRKGEAERLLLTRELSHRMKNTLAMVQAVVTQSLRNATSLEDASHLASERIQALGRAQDMLTESNWETADVRNVVSAALAPHLNGDCRFTIEGPSADLTAQQGMGLALAIHELATNATKYGALSSDGGHVMVSWTIEGGRFRFGWQETGGPTVSPPTHKGFGSRLTERVVPSYFSGTASMAYPKEGAVYVLDGSL